MVIDVGWSHELVGGLVTELRCTGWPRVVVVGSSRSPHSVRVAIREGALGYLVDSEPGVADSKPGHKDNAVPVLHRFPSELFVDDVAGTPQELSRREIQVLRLVAEGKSNREIGTKLLLSGFTVKSHLSRISKKLRTGDRAQMVLLAMRAGVVR
ncbi:response regulator transcription factor [Amycolatopsis japonica]